MTYITYTIKLIFKVYKKLIKCFFINFFLYIKMANRYYKKTKQQKDSEKRLLKDIKIFVKKKKTKDENSPEKDIKFF